MDTGHMARTLGAGALCSAGLSLCRSAPASAIYAGKCSVVATLLLLTVALLLLAVALLLLAVATLTLVLAC